MDTVKDLQSSMVVWLLSMLLRTEIYTHRYLLGVSQKRLKKDSGADFEAETIAIRYRIVFFGTAWSRMDIRMRFRGTFYFVLTLLWDEICGRLKEGASNRLVLYRPRTSHSLHNLNTSRSLVLDRRSHRGTYPTRIFPRRFLLWKPIRPPARPYIP